MKSFLKNSQLALLLPFPLDQRYYSGADIFFGELNKWGLHQEAIDIAKENFLELIREKTFNQCLNSLAFSCICSQDTEFLDLICAHKPFSQAIREISRSCVDKQLDLELTRRLAYKNFFESKAKKDLYMLNLNKLALGITDTSVHDFIANITREQDAIPNKLCINSTRLFEMLLLENGLYISNINPTRQAGSSSRALQICRNNNLGYLYLGDGACIDKFIYDGVRVYPINRVSANIESTLNINIPASSFLRGISHDSTAKRLLKFSRFRNINSFLKSIVHYSALKALLGHLHRVNTICIGYIWNSLSVYYLLKGTERHSRTVSLDTHDIMSERFEDLKAFRSNSWKIKKEEEFAILKSYDKVIAINDRDRSTLETSGIHNVISLYPRISPVASEKQEKKFDILYIGGAQLANIQSLEWFIHYVLKITPLTLGIAGSICQNKRLSRIIAKYNAKNAIIYGNYESLEDLHGISSFGIAPLLYGSGTKLKVIDYLSLYLPIVGTNAAFQGFDGFDKKDGFFRVESPEDYLNAFRLALDFDTANLPDNTRKSFQRKRIY